MVAVSRHNENPVRAVGSVGFDHLGDALRDLLFRLLARGILVLERRGQTLRLFFVLTQQELQCLRRGIHSSRSVEARRQAEGDVLRRERFSLESAAADKRCETGAVGVGESRETCLDDVPVLTLQRHDVRHRADGGEVAVERQKLFRIAALERRRQFERHPRAAQGFAGAFVARQLRVDHRHGVGQLGGRKMVVRHNHVDAQFLRTGNGRMGGNAVVNGDDQRHVPRRHQLDRIFRQTVSVVVAARELIVNVGSDGVEIGVQQCGRGHAVHIIVAEDRDALSGIHRRQDAADRFVHIEQQTGRRQLFARAEHFVQRCGRRLSPRAQDAARERRKAGVHGHCLYL